MDEHERKRYRQARDGDIELSYEIPLRASFEKKATKPLGLEKQTTEAEGQTSDKTGAEKATDFVIDIEKYGCREISTLDVSCSIRHVDEQHQSSAVLYLRGSREQTQPTHFRWM